MRIDKSHRAWLIFSALALAAGCGAYYYHVYHGWGSLNGPSGASLFGLTTGGIAAAFMLFALLIGVRKRFRTWRIGRAEFWMRGHIWLGLLCLPFVWFHGGFHHGGRLTSVIMWLLYIVILTGIFGALLQHFLPKHLLNAVRNETIYEQIPQVIAHMAIEADEVAAVCGPLDDEPLDTWRKKQLTALAVRQGRALLTEERRVELETLVKSAPAEGSAALRDLYTTHIRPYMRHGGEGVSTLTDASRAESLFSQRRLLLPTNLHGPLEDLERLCNEVRQLQYQQRIHRWLHNWVLVHAPLSWALIVLVLVHSFIALRW